MRPVEDKNCYSYGVSQEYASTVSSNFEFHKPNKNSQHRKVLASRSKPTPSKWDDAQKWLVGLSGGGDQNYNKAKPRTSNADDRRLLSSASQKGRDSCSSADGYESVGMAITIPDEGETKKIDYDESFWRINKLMEGSPLSVRSICVRDMGTEMTPIASLDPSRNATPIRAATPVLRSPILSRSSTPGRCHQGTQPNESYPTGVRNLERKSEAVLFGRGNGGGRPTKGEGEQDGCKIFEKNGLDQAKNPLESRAMAWDEAERTKYMARYKREEVKIQAWENHEKRKAEIEMKGMEVKAERVKARAQERLTNKLAASRRIAEEKRSNAEAKLNEKTVRTSERADYIRRTGHLPPSFFSFKLPSLCG